MKKEYVGRTGKIGKEEIEKAAEILQQYKKGKENLENRIIENEQYWKMQHWEHIRSKNPNDPKPSSGWLFNSIANKHADAMDNYPEPNVLAREEGDKEDAKMLSDILPVVLEKNGFRKTYSKCWWRKLKAGTGVYGIFWNQKKENGIGDIDIQPMDLLNMFWEPGIEDIQKSRNLFTIELTDNDILVNLYPFLEGKLGESSLNIAKYKYDDTVDTSEKSAVVDWYYKVFDGEKDILHYCKFVNNEVLYASENDPDYKDNGFYNHGKYPFVFDVMFMEEGTPAGFGYVDVMKDCQMYIDKMNQIIIKNTLSSARNRYFVKDTGSVNEEEFADMSKDFVHVTGSNLGDESIRQIITNPLSPVYINVLQAKIDELKETSGNRDFSQGGTTSGVTAASAIAALQEAGSKLSRDMISAAYDSYTELCYLAIELIRQFYDEPRQFRIVGELGKEEYISYSNASISPQEQGSAFGVDFGQRMPIFDIKITAQKASSFSKLAQNELAKELYGMGFFNPEYSDQVLTALKMMDFEGKDMIEQSVSQNGTLFNTVQQLQATVMKLSQIVDSQNGTNIQQNFSEEQMRNSDTPVVEAGQAVTNNSLGADVGGNSLADQARQRAQNVTVPK